MREIFNRRFFKYFIVTFLLVLFFSAVGGTVNYFSYYFENPVSSFIQFFKLGLYVALGLIPAALCVSIALASFVSYRNLPEYTDIKRFFSKLLIGLFCIIPLAGTVYLFDLYAQPGFRVKSAEILWDLRSESSLRMIGDEPLNSPGFKNFNPSLSTRKMLYFRIDSLETTCDELKEEAGRLLSQLPEPAASDAYEAYGLEWLGVDYQFASSPTGTESENLIHNRLEELFLTAEELHEANMKRLQYRFERKERMFNAVGLLLQFLLFAVLGYISRKKPIQNILGVIAIIIVAGVFLNQITAMGKKYADQANSKAREYEREMRKR